MSWKELFIAGRQGDEDSYNKLLSELTTAIRAYLSGQISDRGLVEDICQEVLISIHIARETYDENRPFKPWLYAIVRRRMIDGFRKRGRTTGRELSADELFPDMGAGSDIETRIDLQRAVSNLSDEKLQALTSITLEGDTTEEAAKKLNVKSSTFRVMYHRLVSSIKQELE